MESESRTANTKISDSGYSISCNTNSQRSASSKSRISGSNSSRSSGYCGPPNPDGSVNASQQPPTKRNNDIMHNNKLKSTIPHVEVTTTPAETLAELSPKMHVGVASLPTILVDEPSIENLENSDTKPVEAVITAALLDQPVTYDVIMGEENHMLSLSEDTHIEKPYETEMKTDHDVSEPVTLPSIQSEEGFCCVISMYDGVVLYTTPSLTSVLGFPKDTWLGRSFIDFVHPKDKDTFLTQVTREVALPLDNSQKRAKGFSFKFLIERGRAWGRKSQITEIEAIEEWSCYKENNSYIFDTKIYLYVCLRRYRELKSSGYGVAEQSVSYQAFHLTITLKQIADVPEISENNSGMFLVVVAVPVYPSYKVPGERKNSSKFGMRHTAKCIFSHVDPDVVTNFGYLPQDMLGKSIFDFYHPDDMLFLKEVYESVMKMCQTNGSVFRSKPYRFLVQNGCFVMIETEWSSFVNPWSKRLEFVSSLHQVIQGPLNPDVFALNTNDEYKNISEEIIIEGKLIQADILQILNKGLSEPDEVVKCQISKRCRDLKNVMESLLDDVNRPKFQLELPLNSDLPFLERDSVMLGEISPHHDYYDSKSSSETPPSYNQLNYNENIKRFFQSKPKTTISDDSNGQSNDQIEPKNVPECVANYRKCLSPVENSTASGFGSAGNLISDITNQILESRPFTNATNDSYKPLHLTESMLIRHNEDMEKVLMNKHKAERSHNKEKGYKKPEKYMRDNNINHARGSKRSCSHSWEEDFHDISKRKSQAGCPNRKQTNGSQTIATPTNQILMNVENQSMLNVCRQSHNVYQSGIQGDNLWPPSSLATSPMTHTHSCYVDVAPDATSITPFMTGMLPVYYIPTMPVQQRPISSYVEQPPKYQVQCLPGINYNFNMVQSPSLLCPKLPVINVPVATTKATPNTATRTFGIVALPKINPCPSGANTPRASSNVGMQPGQPRFGSEPSSVMQQPRRPSSQATSVKAEPGSKMGSIASDSVANKIGNNARTPKQPKTSYTCNKTYEESSCYSSSYSSFLKTDNESESNDDTSFNRRTNNIIDEILGDRKHYPMRKKDPPWVESVSVSSDLIYRYQIVVKDIEDILKDDLSLLKQMDQPMMVNDQLSQLYAEMELGGLSRALTLEEGYTSSSGSDNENTANQSQPKRRRSYNTLMMIYEENAPLPPPESAP